MKIESRKRSGDSIEYTIGIADYDKPQTPFYLFIAKWDRYSFVSPFSV